MGFLLDVGLGVSFIHPFKLSFIQEFACYFTFLCIFMQAAEKNKQEYK